jgi:S-adenosylmethionine synthetase
VISTQHDDGFESTDDLILQKIKKDVSEILIPRVKAQMSQRVQDLFQDDYKLHVNPTGKFVIGGPHGDSGLTGRKIIVDTYGGKGAHGGGAFSGKDPSKVDRSAAYATRHIAKNLVAAGVCDEVLVQVAYAIGVAEPVGLYVDTYGTSKVKLSDGEIASKIVDVFPMKPYQIEQRFNLRTPIYSETSSYGHMGRTPKVVTKSFEAFKGGDRVELEVELFPWEKLDRVNEVKKEFGL